MRSYSRGHPTFLDVKHPEQVGVRCPHRFAFGSFDGKQITIAASLCLLLLEILYEGENCKNHEEEILKKGVPVTSIAPVKGLLNYICL